MHINKRFRNEIETDKAADSVNKFSSDCSVDHDLDLDLNAFNHISK